MRRAGLVFAAGIAIVVLVLIPAFQINPSDAQVEGRARARATPCRPRRDHGRRVPGRACFSVRRARRERRDARAHDGVARRSAGRQGSRGARRRRRGGKGGRAVEAFGTEDALVASREEDDLEPAARRAAALEISAGRELTLGGVGPEERDFVNAVYGKFPYVLLFVLILTFSC